MLWFRLLGWFLLVTSPLQAQTVLTYPSPQGKNDHRSEYALELLSTALSYSAPDLQLKPSRRFYSRSRALEELKPAGDIDVVWTMSSPEREQRYLPIRFSIYQQYAGYRLLLIHQQQAERFKALKTGQQWRSVRFAQVHDWLDTAVLRAHGLQVQGVSEYQNLFPLLMRQRVDAVPRGVLEISDEADSYLAQGLVIEANWLIRYPAVSYFFVGQHNKELARHIEVGLQKMQQNGEFDALFHRHFGAKIAALKLSDRRVLNVHNPWLPTLNEPTSK